MFEEKVQPAVVTKVCIIFMWYMKVYMLFKEHDPVKINKISLKSLYGSVLYAIIEGDDMIDKMSKLDYDLKGKKKKEAEHFMINNAVTFNQIFNLVSKMALKMINSLENDSKQTIDQAISRINNLKENKQMHDLNDSDLKSSSVTLKQSANNEYQDERKNMKDIL
jgi:hypothetical protein